MRRLLATLAALLVLPLLLPASEFDWMVREFSRESGVRQMNIPFFGLARFAVSVAHPAGASELKLAIFENPNFDSTGFSRLVDQITGTAWKPIVRVRSRNGESTNIYAQTQGQNLRLLITSLDHDDATFVQVRIRPESLIKFIDEHDHH
ncbi:MAG TPA: hypothetical protein VGL97_21970 [Bryobacteraceae bacterium]|jgi:hypothetical protein